MKETVISKNDPVEWEFTLKYWSEELNRLGQSYLIEPFLQSVKDLDEVTIVRIPVTSTSEVVCFVNNKIVFYIIN